MKLIGGRLCLDFANTVDWRVGSHPVELIDDFSDLVAWSRRVDIVTDLEADRLLAEAANCPEEAAAALAKAIELREAIFLIFSSIVKGMEPNGDDLSLLNENLAQASSRLGSYQLPAVSGSSGMRATTVSTA